MGRRPERLPSGEPSPPTIPVDQCRVQFLPSRPGHAGERDHRLFIEPMATPVEVSAGIKCTRPLIKVMSLIYLDHNATSPLLPDALQAMLACWQSGAANPSSQHSAGRKARQFLEDAREELATLLGADLHAFPKDRFVFTSGGTESNTLALEILAAIPLSPSDKPDVVISGMEHPSLLAAAEKLAGRGFVIRTCGVTSSGQIDVDQFRDLLTNRTRLASVMLANNETGVIQPVGELARLCRARGVLFHTDASQAAGRIEVSFSMLGADAMTIAAHKFHGPVGIGGLLIRGGLPLPQATEWVVQEDGFRGGTQAVPLAVGMAAALSKFHQTASVRMDTMQQMRDEFERVLSADFPALVVHGQTAPRLPNTSCLAFPGHDRQRMLIQLDLANVACSTGSACASGSTNPSPTLQAMGVSKHVLESSLRFSLGALTGAAEMAEAARRILLILK